MLFVTFQMSDSEHSASRSENEGATPPVEPEFGLGPNGEEVFGVVDPNALENSMMVVGKRGRKHRGSDDEASNAGSDSDEAYAEDSGEEESEYNDDSEDDYNDDYEDIEGASDDNYGDDGEEYGRNRKQRNRSSGTKWSYYTGPNSLSYQQAHVIRQPELPPILAAITDNMVRQKQMLAAQRTEGGVIESSTVPPVSSGTAGTGFGSLTAAQLQEMARNAVSSLAAASVSSVDTSSLSSSAKNNTILLPRTPQVTENIREHVSQELKQSIASMLMNPELRAALIARLQANRANSEGSSVSPQLSQRPIAAAPVHRARQQKVDESGTGEDQFGTIAATRARRQTKQVDYSSYFKDDAFEENAEFDSTTGSARLSSSKKSESTTSNGKRRGRPPKNQPMQASHGTRGNVTERRQRHMYDEGSSDDNDEGVDNASVGSADSSEPGIDKILSHRVAKSKDEFLVKFHGLAYVHAEWIPKEEILAESGGASRVSRFLNKPLKYHHFDDKNIFNPEFTQIDRIMYGWSHPSADDPAKLETSYLVKWRALSADQSTWEKRTFLEGLPDGLDSIRAYEAIPDPWKKRQGALPVGRRPEAASWTKLEASPTYKSDNMLRSYQLEGLNWLVYCWMHKQSCIIADEMGLGKTVQTVSFLDLIYNRFGVRGPFLVVAPLSTLPHWQREFEAWTDLRVLVYHGTEVARDVMFEYEFFYKDPNTDQIIPGLCKFDVILTTYEMTLSGQNHLRSIIWRVGVFDEAHRLKNKVSKAAEVMQLFQIEHKVLLTGTPIQNSVDELFALLNFLQPHRFFSLEHFLKEYGNLKRSEDVERLQLLLKPLMLRRLKEDVEKSIPVKEETIIEVELTSMQKRYYRAILEKNFGFLMKGAKSNNMPNLINTMMELRKCCIHPYLIKGAEDRILKESDASEHEAQMACMVQASGKLVLVDKLLARLRSGGHKVLIFSQMTRCLDILTDYLRWRGYPHERIDGAIRGDERQAAIDRYCDPKNDSFVFLLCTKAGGVGINLTAADTVVIFDSDWNPQNDLQAQARCHRIGQTKSVKIYRLITRNTYEREMFDRAGMKLGLDKAILQKMAPEQLDEFSESSATPQMSKAQVEDLLKRGAYGILMENDDDGVRFMDEDIDSILARRTTVIRHDAKGGESRSAMDGSGSIFSKASFAATADDLDIDLDDPNFWELWAKKMNLDPRQVQSGNVAAAVDDSRIRRVLRRLQTHSRADFVATMGAFPCTLQAQEVSVATPGGGPRLWKEEERMAFISLVLRFGLTRLDRIRAYFPDRSQNDLLACAKIGLKACIEQVAEEEPKFKEDAEKLLLSKIEFERYDKKTARQAALEEGEDDVASNEVSKSDIPYSGATRDQIAEYRSFYRGDDCPESFRAALRLHARNILIILQVVEMVRQIVDELGAAGDGSGAEALAGLSIPNSAGHGPVSWWDRDEDLALLVGTLRYGFGRFDDTKADSSLSWYHRLNEAESEPLEFPGPERLIERLIRVVVAIEKRNRASAKLAMHAMTFGAGRRRAAVEEGEEEEEEEEIPTRGGRFRNEDDEEYLEVMDESKRGRGRPRRKVHFSNAAERFLHSWSKAQRAEFNRLVLSAGLPAVLEEGTGSECESGFGRHEWGVFRQLLLPNGLSSKGDSGDEDDDASGNDEGTSDASRTISTKTDAELDEYLHYYVESCNYSADRPSRRRGRPSKGGRIVEEEDLGYDEAFHDDYDEDLDGGVLRRSPVVPPVGLIEMAPERAKKSLSRMELFSRLRALLAEDREGRDGEKYVELLASARKSSGVPRWWQSGMHDAALLRGVSRFGISRPDLLIANLEEFRSVYDLAVSGNLAVRLGASGAEAGYPVIDGIDAQKIAWPNEQIVLRRVETLVEMLEQDAAASASTERSKAKPRRATRKRGDDELLGDESVVPKKASPRKKAVTDATPKSPKRQSTRAPPAEVSSDMPNDEDFPKMHPGRKRQRTVTDFFGHN